eukprot:Hpha_TRINITY_DN15309_c2_g1::TRINITY_DN15309_c2_g1_i1::g.88947::m.88947
MDQPPETLEGVSPASMGSRSGQAVPGLLYGAAPCHVELTSCVLVLRLHGAGMRDTPNPCSIGDLLDLRALSEAVFVSHRDVAQHLTEPSTGKLFVRVWGRDWVHAALKAYKLAHRVLPEFKEKKVSAAISKGRHAGEFVEQDFCCLAAVEAAELLGLADLLRVPLVLALPGGVVVQDLTTRLEEAGLPELSAVKSRIEGCTIWRQSSRRRLRRDTALCRFDTAVLSRRDLTAQTFFNVLASSRQGLYTSFHIQQSLWSAIYTAAGEGITPEDVVAVGERTLNALLAAPSRPMIPPPGGTEVFVAMESASGAEDRCSVQRDLRVFDSALKPGITYIGVFDGHGGYAAAEFCAQQCGPELARRIALGQPYSRAMVDTLQWLDRRFHQGGGRCGTTATIAIITESDVVVSWLGDSRAVAAMTGVPQDQDLSSTPPSGRSGPTAAQLTFDHSLRNPCEMGLIEAQGGRAQQRLGTLRVDGTLEVTRSVGEGHVRPSVVRKPEVATYPRKGMEFLIVATDGLWKLFENQAAIAAVAAARQLIDEGGSLANGSLGGGSQSSSVMSGTEAEIDYHAITAGLAYDAADRAEGTSDKDDITVAIAFFPKQLL